MVLQILRESIYQEISAQGIVKPPKKGDCRSETVRLFLEQEFMKRLMAIEDAPEEVKFPVGHFLSLNTFFFLNFRLF